MKEKYNDRRLLEPKQEILVYMRRAFFCMTVLSAVSACLFGQTASPDTQTLQALLSEVRALRQELRPLYRTQSIQILLARFQVQEGVVTKSSDRSNESRQKVSETHVHQKELKMEVKRLKDALGSAETPQQQTDLQERIKRTKSELEVMASLAQQQTLEMQSEQLLRDEQDKLGAIESQLDELIRVMGSAAETSGHSRP